MYNYHFAHNFI